MCSVWIHISSWLPLESEKIFKYAELSIEYNWCVVYGCTPLADTFDASTPKSDQFRISTAASPGYYITQYGELDFSSLTQMKHDYATNSPYLTHTPTLYNCWENVLCERGSERVRLGPTTQTLISAAKPGQVCETNSHQFPTGVVMWNININWTMNKGLARLRRINDIVRISFGKYLV